LAREPLVFSGRGIVRGEASARAILSNSPISFLGDVDIRSGTVIGELNDLEGRKLTGRVLVAPSTRGSAGAWRFLYQLKQHGSNPVALVLDELPDPSVVQGAILSAIPVVSDIDRAFRASIRDGDWLAVNGTAGTVTVLREPAQSP